MNIKNIVAGVCMAIMEGLENRRPKITVVHIERDHMESHKAFAGLVGTFFTVKHNPRFTNRDSLEDDFQTLSDIDRLCFGEKPNAIGLFQDQWGMALIQTNPKTYEFLHSAYQAIGTDKRGAYIGKWKLDVTPLKAWFGICGF